MNPIGVILWCFWVWAYNSDPSTWRLMLNGRIHRTCICEKSAEAQIRVYNGKQNCARLDLAIAQEAYAGDWYTRLFAPLICTEIGNEASGFSVIGYGANGIGDWSIQIVEMQFLKGQALAGISELPKRPCIPTVSEPQILKLGLHSVYWGIYRLQQSWVVVNNGMRQHWNGTASCSEKSLICATAACWKKKCGHGVQERRYQCQLQTRH